MFMYIFYEKGKLTALCFTDTILNGFNEFIEKGMVVLG